jgi:ribosomal protein S18 acetylase RimI-like enzyme
MTHYCVTQLRLLLGPAGMLAPAWAGAASKVRASLGFGDSNYVTSTHLPSLASAEPNLSSVFIAVSRSALRVGASLACFGPNSTKQQRRWGRNVHICTHNSNPSLSLLNNISSETMPPIILRPFQQSDQEAAHHLIVSGLGEHFGHIDSAYNLDLGNIWANYVAEGHTFVVAESGGELIGTGALLLLEEQVGQLVRMSVHPAHRRAGLGRALVQHLLEKADERKLRKVIVETNLDWWDAIGLYRSCGFVEYDRDEVSVYMALALQEGTREWGYN